MTEQKHSFYKPFAVLVQGTLLFLFVFLIIKTCLSFVPIRYHYLCRHATLALETLFECCLITKTTTLSPDSLFKAPTRGRETLGTTLPKRLRTRLDFPLLYNLTVKFVLLFHCGANLALLTELKGDVATLERLKNGCFRPVIVNDKLRLKTPPLES